MAITGTFAGGVHPPGHKELTRDKATETFPAPQTAVIPMSQNFGAPCEPMVQKGDEVKMGQKIGKVTSFLCAPVHSPIAGTVKSIVPCAHPLGRSVTGIVIENSGSDEWAEGMNQETDWQGMAPVDMKEKVLEMGIVGLGGATFPTHVKLSPPQEKPIDTIILNGAECEPYLTADYRLMLESPETIVEGLAIEMKIVGAKKGYIGLEDNKPEAYEALRKAAEPYENIEVQMVHTKYPQGFEDMLIKALIDREVPCGGGLPMDVGVVCSNIATAHAICEAIKWNRPLIQRVVTVTGDAVENPSNFWMRIGTSVAEVLEHVGVKPDANKLVMGGPMMGLAQPSADISVIKGTSGILVLQNAPVFIESSCIRCGKCVDVCPKGLVPSTLAQLSETEQIEEVKEINILDCKECGACTYGCPARRPILHLIKFAKGELAKLKAAAAEKK